MSENYEKYAVLDAEIRELTAQKDAVKQAILEEMDESGVDKTETAVGKFTVTKLKTWTYSDKVIELNEDLKAQKATEESTGEATYVEKSSLRFTKTNL